MNLEQSKKRVEELVPLLKYYTQMYFDDKHKSFDRVDKGIYQILLVDIVLIAVLMINPKILLGLIELMLK